MKDAELSENRNLISEGLKGEDYLAYNGGVNVLNKSGYEFENLINIGNFIPTLNSLRIGFKKL